MARTRRTPPASTPGSGAVRRTRTLGVPRRGTRPAKVFTSRPVPIDFAGPGHRYVRADLEIDGIFHGEASYEGRIFLIIPRPIKAPRNPCQTATPDHFTSSVTAAASAIRGIARSTRTIATPMICAIRIR